MNDTHTKHVANNNNVSFDHEGETDLERLLVLLIEYLKANRRIEFKFLPYHYFEPNQYLAFDASHKRIALFSYIRTECSVVETYVNSTSEFKRTYTLLEKECTSNKAVFRRHFEKIYDHICEFSTYSIDDLWCNDRDENSMTIGLEKNKVPMLMYYDIYCTL